ncbi:MAG: S1 RNA-binding domain-containing protein [Anaerolineaceae bacterium]|nr:S1 RNA-binding domain-containing protein [Anaerolineaceae bacterium]
MEQKDTNLEQTKPENSQEDNMASLLEQEGMDIDFPRAGEIKQGVIASISPNQILVSVGAKSEGIITGREFDAIPQEELDKLAVGQEIWVYVLTPEDSHGNLVLSLMRAMEEKSWFKAEELLKTKDSYNSVIRGYNKGGLIVPLEGLNGFVPASQISLSRRAGLVGDTPEKRWSPMVGEEIEVCVIEVDRERRRLILSERAASSETRESIKDRILSELQEGDVRTGKVTSLAEFGAFVNINGADGLVHLSEISWDRIQHPSEVLKVGQEIKVKIINIDREKKRIGLSLRQLLDDPWINRIGQYEVGQLLEGTITRLTKFGAFARIEEDLEGLIHISEISERRIEHPKEVLKEGETITLRVIKIEPENHRIGLSIRRVDSMAFAEMDWKTLEDMLLDEVELDDTESSEKQEVVPEENHEVPSEEKEDVVPEENHEVPSEEKQEVVPEENHEVPSEEKEDVVPEENHEVPSEEKEDVVPEENHEVPSEEKEDVVPEENHEVPSEEKEDVVTEAQQDEQPEVELEAQQDEQPEVESEEKPNQES